MDLNKYIQICNLRKLAEATDISYQVLRNYRSGRTKNISEENKKKILDYMRR